MTWPATTRYGLEPAPGALGLVQDLLNTVCSGAYREPDLLGDIEAARAWVTGATAQWSAVTAEPVPQVAIDGEALEELRAFREELHELAAWRQNGVDDGWGFVPVLRSASAVLQLGEDGVVRLEARGTGWRRLASLVLAAVFEAQQADTRRRLKTCRNPCCRVAFYDRSRNNSGVWHEVKSCGNAANLRAYRARQRTRGH
jgi:predicted RNA-binding Zn ribbon-like protein